MEQGMRDGVSGQLRIGAVLFVFALILSLFLGLSMSRSVAALPLVDDKIVRTVVQPIRRHLPGDSNKQANSTASHTSPNNNTDTQSAASPASSTASSRESADVLPEPVIEPLQPVAPIDASDMPQRMPPLTTELNFSRPSLPKVTLAKVTGLSLMPIQATENGWRVFGLTWYWWLLMAGAAGYGIRQLLFIW